MEYLKNLKENKYVITGYNILATDENPCLKLVLGKKYYSAFLILKDYLLKL